MSSLTGSTGYNGESSGSKMRGVDPSMKHIPGHHRFQQFDKNQMDLYQQRFGDVGPDSYLSRLAGGDESLFAEMEAPALRQFSGLLGNMASRFSGMGMGARRSSGFQNTMGAMGSDFAQQLQSQRQGLQRQAIMDLSGLSNQLLQQQPYGLQERGQKQQPFWKQMLGMVSPVGGDIASGGETNYTKNFLQLMGGM